MVPSFDIDEYIASLKASPKFGQQVVYHRHQGKIEGRMSSTKPPLSPEIWKMLQKKGINRLYTHQAKAIENVLRQKDVLVATPTASGKSMIYNLPIISEILRDPQTTALYLFPLKALAQDQKNTMDELWKNLPDEQFEQAQQDGEICVLFDGDTSSYKRRKIRNNPPPVIMTNPEMLHLSILPYHRDWIEFFHKLKFIVIDEVHTYRGILGSHMHWVLHRLQRIAAYYSASPVFVLLSATIGNPEQLGKKLLGRNIHVITDSGAPQAEKNMLFLNPWDGAAYAASQLLEAALKRGLRTIVYTQSRKLTELINIWTSARLGELEGRLSAYRAGFLPEERREVEKKLFQGELLGVISTSALELGINIGDLDLCILVGYPGSIMATWQRGGRVGRAQRKSAIVLIAQEDALDQHFMRNSEDFFRRKPEAAILNPENETVTDQHLVCCAAELPLQKEECQNSSFIMDRIAYLGAHGKLLQTASETTWVSPGKFPQRHVNLRGWGVQLAIINSETGEIAGEIDSSRAIKECHPGAVYLHREVTWVVDRLDTIGKEIAVHREKPVWYTRPISEKQTEILEAIEQKTCFGVEIFRGKLKVLERVTGYQKRSVQTQKIISTNPLDPLEQTIETEGLWVIVPQEIVEKIEREKLHFTGGIHAAEHAMIAMFPMLVLCDRNDVGGISCPFHEQTGAASIFIYDGYAGGAGLAGVAYEQIEDLLTQTLAMVTACECVSGCPSCIHSPKCGSGNRPIDKKACIALLEYITGKNENRKNADKKLVTGAVTELAPDSSSAAVSSKKGKGSEIKSAPGPLLPGMRKGAALLPERYGVFDLETIRSAAEVGGWGNIEQMGMSLGVVYDSEKDDYITYLESEAEQLVAHLETLDLVVGFNNKRFDNRVLSSYTHKNLANLTSLDLLEEVQNYLGYRLSLNALAAETLGEKKSADGLQALEWYKEGKINLIERYCRKDVELTKDLMLHCLEKGFMFFKNKAGQVVKLPLDLETSISRILKAE